MYLQAKLSFFLKYSTRIFIIPKFCYLCIGILDKAMAKHFIKEYIKASGMTAAEVASKLGITPGAFSQTVNGNPTVEMIAKVAEVLNIESFELLKPPGNSGTLKCPRCGKPIKISVE